MIFLRRMLSVFLVAARRLFSQRGLVLATMVGLITALAITMSIPLYADAVYYQILQDELAGKNRNTRILRPPLRLYVSLSRRGPWGCNLGGYPTG